MTRASRTPRGPGRGSSHAGPRNVEEFAPAAADGTSASPSKDRAHTPRQRATARIGFIRALAKYAPDAIRDLREWRLSSAASESESQQVLRSLVCDISKGLVHGIDEEGAAADETLRCVRDDSHVPEPADEERRAKVLAWTKQLQQFGLEPSWMKTWAYYALVRWEVARCAGSHSDDEAAALALVLTESAMLAAVEDRHPEYIDVGAEDLHVFDQGDETIGDPLPAWQRPLGPPLAYPHPSRETKQQFRERCERAWDEATEALRAEGFSSKERPSLQLHCEWLVRHQIEGPQVRRDIAKRHGLHRSAVPNAIRPLAELIDLPLREC
jgi:hypothetical protein